MTAKKDKDPIAETVETLNTDQKARVKASDKANRETRKNVEHADNTTKLVADDDAVSRTEHATGSRQPDDGSYDGMREQAPLAAVDIPQVVVVADNDTDVPGEKTKHPAGTMSHAEAAQHALDHHTTKKHK